MCQGREHTYTIEVSLQLKGGSKKEYRVRVQAKGLPEAFAKADAYVYHQDPNADFVHLSGHHSQYPSRESAEEHGAAFALTYDINPPMLDKAVWLLT